MSKLFNKQGYIPLKEYIEDISCMTESGPWKLPFGFGDRLHFFFLKVVFKFSWFSALLFVLHESSVSPAYAVILAYLKKQKVFDYMMDTKLRHRGFYSFYLEKKVASFGKETIISGQGISEDRSTALSIAIGEMIERYIVGIGDTHKSALNASFKEISESYEVLYPPKYHRFLDVQKKKFKELTHTEEDTIDWVKGRNLVTEASVYIPKQITSWFDISSRSKGVFMNSTSNGAAGYFTQEGAILRGLLEVVQRDGFFVHWLTMTAPQVVLQDTLSAAIQEKIQEFTIRGVSLHVLNITSLDIPSILVVGINTQAEVPQIIVSAGVALTFDDAIKNALQEMVMMAEVFYFEKGRYEEHGLDFSKKEPFISNFGRMGRHAYWRGEEKVKEFGWFISGEEISYQELSQQDISSLPDDASKLAKCVAILEVKGKDYYPVVYYPKNNIQEKLGFYVVQVYIPKAFPLYITESYGTFDSDRLDEFARSKNKYDWKLNQEPHMFP